MPVFRVVFMIGTAAAFLISLAVYTKTIAPTVPFWDGGEFIAASYILGIPHPPGSPLYILIGRLFTMLPDLGMGIAWLVNFSSCLFSALTVTAVYLVVVKTVTLNRDRDGLTGYESVIICCSALTGALLLAFSDTFWFNAVEAEVYALSMLIMMVCTWAILHWIENHEQSGSERYLFLIAYLAFLGIAVHMFTMLVLPAAFLSVVYTDRVIRSNRKLILLCAVMGLILFSVVASIDVFFLAVPLAIAGLALSRGRLPWGFPALAFVLSVAVMFFGLEGVGSYNGLPLLVIGGFEATWGTVMFSVALVSLGLALASATADDAGRYKWPFWIIVLCLAVLGYSVNFYVPIRAAQQPVINENDPSSWANFEGFLERKQYGQEGMLESMFNRKGSWSSQFGNGENIGFWRFFSRQFSDPGFPYWLFPVLLIALGILAQAERDRRSILFLGGMLLTCSLGLILYMNFSDGTRGIQREVRIRDYFYTPAFVYASVLMGIGMRSLLGQISTWLHRFRLPMERGTAGIAVLSIALPLVPFTYHYESHSREGNYIPYDYAYNILQSCDENGLIFTNGDNDTFTLWFLQEVEGIRKDVRVINLSLLNTNWYIKQLKYQEPRVPIALADETIDALSLQRWDDREVEIAGMTWTVPRAGTLGEDIGYLRVQDLMVLHILEQNNWEKPVFFAVTVPSENDVGLDGHMQMEGMAWRIVRDPNPELMDLDRTRHNLWNVYQYRGIADPEVYKDEQVSTLLRNYTVSFHQLALNRWKRGEIDQAIAAIEKYLEYDITNGVLERLMLIQFHADKGMFADVEPYAFELAGEYKTFDGYTALNQAMQKQGRVEEAIALLERGVATFPESTAGYDQLVSLYYQRDDTERVLETLERWQRIAPGDSVVQAMIDELKEAGDAGGP
ncbi:MAG: DUF2723 domain-containing protein [Gemmatimonadetes bacterium]|nr:DUF2723 domain-containing protein [Gemmatimonadota bacterium]